MEIDASEAKLTLLIHCASRYVSRLAFPGLQQSQRRFLASLGGRLLRNSQTAGRIAGPWCLPDICLAVLSSIRPTSSHCNGSVFLASADTAGSGESISTRSHGESHDSTEVSINNGATTPSPDASTTRIDRACGRQKDAPTRLRTW